MSGWLEGSLALKEGGMMARPIIQGEVATWNWAEQGKLSKRIRCKATMPWRQSQLARRFHWGYIEYIWQSCRNTTRQQPSHSHSLDSICSITFHLQSPQLSQKKTPCPQPAPPYLCRHSCTFRFLALGNWNDPHMRFAVLAPRDWNGPDVYFAILAPRNWNVYFAIM